jgi:hypothetical protein
MSQIVEITWDSLSRHGEELCGDWVKVVSTPEDLIVVLSDGLGSGVKANILATLTAEIAGGMLERGASIDEVVETLVDTLPECQVRHLAYATFAVLRLHKGREAYLVEYDSPPLILIRRGSIAELPVHERLIAGRTIRESHFFLEPDDYLVMVSDGYLHAGVGGLYRMGWGRENIAIAVQRWAATHGDTRQLTQALRRTCLKLSNDRPGDDATCVTMWARPKRRLTVLTGPPADTARDGEAVHRLMAAQGMRVICGGTTAQMAARVLKRPLRVAWGPRDGGHGSGPKLPPVGLLDGVDLVTEGILTLSSAVDRLRTVMSVHDLPPDQDAATRLARMLLHADQVDFLVGDAINPQQLADVVRGVPMRALYLEELIARLRECGKGVSAEHF